jgi:hypothetical protein
MHWPPKEEDRAAWSAVGGVLTAGAVAVGLASVWWPLAVALGILGVYLMLAPLLPLPPWYQREEPLPPTGITAGHDIKAGRDIETDGPIKAGRSVEAGGRVRSPTQPDALLLAATQQRRASLAKLGIVNPLVGQLMIRQHAAPLEHNEAGCVIRVVIAGDREPTDAELRSGIKDTLKSVLERSGMEQWISEHTNGEQANPVGSWTHATPNTGRIVTFKRDWGALGGTGSALIGKVTLQLPPHLMLGSRVILILDLIERSADPNEHLPRLNLSLPGLHELLHILSKTAIDEIAAAVFPLIYKDRTPLIVGPNYEIQFGDRELDNLVQIPSSFKRPDEARNSPWANINTPEGSDASDLEARDTVLRAGFESVFRSNEYDGIEDEIAKLLTPAAKRLGLV